MENLFTTQLTNEGQAIEYHVVFEQEKYVFNPIQEAPHLPSFSFRREQDQWMSDGAIKPELQNQAVAALERFLLQQH